MKLLELKEKLATVKELEFELESGEKIPTHFHITELGEISKRYIDCGGTIRNEQTISMQIWYSHDLDHRLQPEKLTAIIDIGLKKLNLGNHAIEVEYQGNTIGKYDLKYRNDKFILLSKTTACLAEDQCGISTTMQLPLSVSKACCTPGSGCC